MQGWFGGRKTAPDWGPQTETKEQAEGEPEVAQAADARGLRSRAKARTETQEKREGAERASADVKAAATQQGRRRAGEKNLETPQQSRRPNESTVGGSPQQSRA